MRKKNQFGFLASLENKIRRRPFLRFIIVKKQCEIISSANLKGIKYSKSLYLQEKQALRTPLAQDYSNRYNLIDCGHETYFLCVLKNLSDATKLGTFVYPTKTIVSTSSINKILPVSIALHRSQNCQEKTWQTFKAQYIY